MSSQWDAQGGGRAPGQGGPPQQQGGYGQQGQPNPQQYQQPPYSQPQGQYPPQGQQAWGQNPPAYGAPSAYSTPPLEKRSSVLGLIGLVIVVAATVVLVITAFSFGQAFGQFALDVQRDGGRIMDENDLLNDPLARAWLQSASGTLTTVTFACFAGLVGWVVSIIATVQRRGRIFGIIGIVLGVLSLGFGFAALFAGMGPAFSQLQG